ncbi:unnamed protein product [Closterium sp. Yama58-4]|nr:unnamed protein product [Closterium sp. Yama58-4]
MRAYVNRVEELGERLVELDASVDDDNWIMTLLAGLGEAWSVVITTLDGTQATWKKEQVVARLINEEVRCTKLHGDAIGAAHFFRDAKAKGTSHFKRRNDGNNRGSSKGSATASSSSWGGPANANRARTGGGACWFCKRTKHWWRECPVKPANWKSSSSDDNRRAHVATFDNNDREFIFVASGTTVGGVDAWVLTHQHMTTCTTLLNNMTTEDPSKRVMFGNRDTLDVIGQGELQLMVDGGPLTIKNVFVVLGMADGVHIGTARRAGGLFVLDALPSVATAQAATSTITLSTWHNRFGHLHHDAIQAMETKGIVQGLEFVRSGGDDEKCVSCLEGKMARKPFPPSTKPDATEPLKLVHTDLCGPITPTLKGGARYILTLLDDATRTCWIRLLKHENATSTLLKQCVARVETESGFKVKRLCSDGGGEYTARELGDWLKGRWTAHEFSTPYTPQQNGVAERLNRALMESARSLLSYAHVEKHWRGEAVTLATRIRNWCVTKALLNKTPLEAWSATFPSKSTNVPSVIIVPPPLDAADEADDALTAPPPSMIEGENGSGAVGVSGDEGNAKESDPSPPPPTITPTLVSTRTRRTPHPNSKYDDYSLVAGDDEGGRDAMCLEAYTDTPSTYQGAMSSAEAAEWKRALQEEYDLLMANDANGADVQNKLAVEFSKRYLGAVSHYLGMHIDRDRGNKTLALHQNKYLESVVDRFGMIESKPTPTPMEAGFHPLAVSDENPMDPKSAKTFHSIAGSCMYTAVSTRPDLSFPVGVLGRVVSNPMVEHV